MSQPFTIIPATTSLLRRVTAVLAVAMMLMLTVANGGTVVHDWLHPDSSHDTDHQCAVLLFANGVTLTSGTTALAGTELVWRGLPTVTVEERFLISPRYLRQPERGPPVS